MSDKPTANERLRQLLDKRGVEYSREGCETFFKNVHIWAINDKELCISISGLSPEQAVEATLGRGTCKMDPYTDAAFRVVQAAGDTDFVDYAEVCECSACGASVIVPHEYERVTAGSDELWPKFNYCPSCGRAVVE